MHLMPYDRFRHLDNMKREFDRFFTNDHSHLSTGFGHSIGNPSVDVHETNDEVIALCDIPGLEKKEDVSIEIENNMLLISGSINRRHEIMEENIHRQERYMGRFHRSIGLPAVVNPEDVRATYKNGVLVIHMPKAQPNTKKRIDVDFH
ncbi:Hsp20/alpha crystallin family protein [Paenibacillus sp. R14(2021)]|uniref:Hsp20/alpha crystallin family protein n=1 Tax=Paenibacillus sp. R14(2021) TaxID=2859228 RepID=UPI001C612FBA|nr:Hsp20/alpha crystallin family protein [Paenibacillus sp. R14(2021)]